MICEHKWQCIDEEPIEKFKVGNPFLLFVDTGYETIGYNYVLQCSKCGDIKKVKGD